MDGRKRLSGAKYKKNALIKKQKHTVLLNSCLKIYDMFKSSTLTTEVINTNVTNEPCSIDTTNVSPNAHESLPVCVPLTWSTPVLICQLLTKQMTNKLIQFQRAIIGVIDNCYPRSDPATWVIDNILREFISSYGFTQDLKNLNISNSKRPYINVLKEYFNKNCLQTTLKNGENIARGYLVYSESKGALFCYPCMLFGGVTIFATTRFSLWKKTEERITEHSNSLKHRNCMIKLKNHSKVTAELISN
ncbi:zinc finger MYM-type protein 5-like isoform X6 [Aphis craccivora]|uniref:Zinc finger MYM-type protein 5-like isoform X6 n=1 Tax=Aphis craccivora TaxID=307492 RepID=A0A6G0YDX8_APHCR|nr:zinc finger MYM-type protein 5-like isoform X6 [Aphis craccivora]